MAAKKGKWQPPGYKYESPKTTYTPPPILTPPDPEPCDHESVVFNGYSVPILQALTEGMKVANALTVSGLKTIPAPEEPSGITASQVQAAIDKIQQPKLTVSQALHNIWYSYYQDHVDSEYVAYHKAVWNSIKQKMHEAFKQDLDVEVIAGPNGFASGGMITHQALWHSVDADKPVQHIVVHSTNPGVYGSVYFSSGQGESSPKKIVSGHSITHALSQAIPGFQKMRSACPDKDCAWIQQMAEGHSTLGGCVCSLCEGRGDGKVSLQETIIHLNDQHHWSREAIADWLDTLDFDLTLRPVREEVNNDANY